MGGKPAPEVQGMPAEKVFFIAFAQNWRIKFREAALRRQLLTDQHAAGPYRAAEVRNLDAWYRLFDVKPGEVLYLPPEERIRIW